MTDDAMNTLMQKQAERQTRLDALLVIVENFNPADLSVLSDLLRDETEDPELRSAIALSLGKISGQEALEALISVSEDADKIVRNYVMQALGMTEMEAAAPVLIKALQDKSNTVFASASQALGELGKPAAPYLIALLSDGAEDARCIAAWQLGEMNTQSAIPALVEAILKPEQTISVKALCIWALGEIGLGSPDVLEVLSDARKQPEPDIRLRAETAMKKIASQSN